MFVILRSTNGSVQMDQSSLLSCPRVQNERSKVLCFCRLKTQSLSPVFDNVDR